MMGTQILKHLQANLPLQEGSLVLPIEEKKIGLVLVDFVNGFCTVGAGNLVPIFDLNFGLFTEGLLLGFNGRIDLIIFM